MWPFKAKKYPPLDQLPADGSWAVCQGENNGQPMFVRVNNAAKPFSGHPQLSIRFGIAVPLHDPNEHGLPSEAEMEELSEIEEHLFEAVSNQGIVVLIITTSGMREFVVYLRSTKDAEAVFDRVRQITSTHDIQHYAQPDPKWELFGEFTDYR